MESTAIKKAVVIYHDNCMDGFASAWAFHVLKEKNYPDGVEYIPANYNQFPPASMNFINKDVFIVDFSYPREDILYINSNANSTTVLDHHKTAKEALENWEDKPENVTIVFDMSRSGAGITWDYFYESNYGPTYGNTLRPLLIDYVEDRDLWKFKLAQSKEVNAVIAITPKDFKAYNNLSSHMNMDIHKVTEIGEYLNIQHQQICESIVKDARPIVIQCAPGEEGYHGLACNCTPEFRSEVGDLLYQKSGTFGATYHSLASGAVKWSVRSSGNYDVEKICKAFGGGGHKNASAFIVDLNLEKGVDPGMIFLRPVR